MSLAALLVAKATTVLAGGAVALRSMDRYDSGARFRVACAALLASLLLPVLSLVVPEWRVLPVWSQPPAARPAEHRAWRPAEPLAEHGAPGATASRGLERSRSEPAALADASSAHQARLTTARTILAIWLAGSLWIGARLVLGLLALERLRRRAERLGGDDWALLAARLSAELGLRRPVELRRIDRLTMPMTCGVFRPAVLLPADCDEWPESGRSAVLAHELAHVARRDVAWQVLGRLALAVYWFHPLAWLLERRMVLERELACDALVLRLRALRSRRDARDYARELLTLASRYREGPALAAIGAASRSDMERRIMAILDPSKNRQLSRRARIALATTAVAVLVPLATLAWSSPRPAQGPGSNASLQPREGQSDVLDFQRALRRAGIDPHDTERLLEALESDSALLRGAGAWALGHQVTGAGGRDDRVDPGARPARVMPARVVPALVERLDDLDARVRQWAARSLGRLGDPQAVEPLAAHTSDEDSEVREWVVRSIAELGGARTAVAQGVGVEALADRLQDPDPEVREWALRALPESGDPRAAWWAIDLLDDPDAEVRQFAARVLGELGEPAAVDHLLARLDERDEEALEWIVRALGDLGDPRAVGPLTTLAEDSRAPAAVQEWAIRSISAIASTGPIGSERRAALWNRSGPEPLIPALLVGPVEPGPPEAIASAIRSLGSDAPEARQWAARSLGELGDDTAIDSLVFALEDPDAEVREWAIRALGSLRARRAAGALISSLGDRSPEVREWAVRSLGVTGDPSALDPLIGRLEDEDVQVREWAARALGALGDSRAVAAISARLDDESPDVRYWAKRALEALRESAE
ncbi:MAG TPA: HEAT repeat domain-containing protein [Thermoanaerobaculia bacterium]|nr:HEAT repeat domain-containing protein [Thermoanaerobaculia bacterium]